MGTINQTLIFQVFSGGIRFDPLQVDGEGGHGLVDFNKGGLDLLVALFLGPGKFDVVLSGHLSSESFLGANLLGFDADSGDGRVVFLSLAVAVVGRGRGRGGRVINDKTNVGAVVVAVVVV